MTISQISELDSINQSFDHIELRLNAYLTDFQEKIAVRGHEVSQNEIQKRARGIQLSSKADLPKNVAATAHQITQNSFLAYVQAAYGETCHTISSLTALIFIHLKQLFSTTAKQLKQAEQNELKIILSTLRHLQIIVPQTEKELIKAFSENTHEKLRSAGLALINNLVTDSTDKNRISQLLYDKKPLEAFRYIHTLTLYNSFCKQAESYEAVMTPSDVTALLKAMNAMRNAGSTKDANKLIFSIFCRHATKEWLDKELKNMPIPTSEKFTQEKERAYKMLRENNEKIFKEAASVLLDQINQKTQSPLDSEYLREMISFLKTDPYQLFQKITLHSYQEKIVTQCNKKAVDLLHLLEKQDFIHIQESHLQRLNTIANSCLTLYGHYGTLLEVEEKNALSKTKYASLYGGSVTLWRKINDVFIQCKEHITPQKAHSICSC
ncbi:MAG: hypothetical protein JWO53_445, partial [Chlamydiia bacterium]|nr:hypothetical protein [Chlamydiia bacterium]